MRIEGAAGGYMGVQMPMAQGTDAMSRNLQSQIQKKQQELQKLSENQDMSMEEKMKRRQAIQQEIADLNLQLRQHQIELRREEQQSQKASAEDMLGGKRTSAQEKNGQGTGMSQASTALISADSSMKQAKVQGGVTKQMEGRAGVLKAEIWQDGARGNDTQRKEEELADVEQKAANAASGQLSSLADADKAMKEAAEDEKDSRKADRNEIEKEEKKEEKDEYQRSSGKRPAEYDVCGQYVEEYA